MKQFLIFLICLTYYNAVYSQDILYNLSFEANQGNYNDSYGEYYYHVKKEGNSYRLTTKKEKNIFQEAFDTIVKNAHFIKTVKQNIINIYRIQNLEKIEIPHLKQVYFMRNGLEVLTNQGAQYFDNSIIKITNFPKRDLFACGTVYKKRYTLKHNEKTKKYSIEISKGHFGGMVNKIILDFINPPENIESLSFLNEEKYTSQSVNNKYYTHPDLIKIIKDGKSGIYSYNLDDAKFSKKGKRKKYVYNINATTGDTIFIPIPERISFTKKGKIKLNQILPTEYNRIQQSEINGLIYLYKNNQIGIYPNHIITSFDKFKEKTTSFYAISKNGKQGWIDIRTFQEYYF